MSGKLQLLAVSTLIASAFVAPAYSQIVLEEIVVTAAKREQTLQEVPIAVSVTDADTIQKSQILDINDLQTVVPSLRVTQLQSSANTNFLIRGFGNGANNPGIEPSVGVFIDGVYRSRAGAALSDLPNLERIEVLRGPQSTLFGKNASAGVISVITKAPEHEFGGSANAVFGNYGQTVVKGFFTGPLSENAAFSLAGGLNQRDGYFDNLEDGSEVNERDRWSVRGQLLLEPTDNVTLRIIGDVDETDELCCGASNLFNGPTFPAVLAVGGNLVPEAPFSRDVFYNENPRSQIENSGLSLQADIDFSNMTLTSITSFRTNEISETLDADFTSGELIVGENRNTDIDTLTQEIRLTSSVGEKADWMVGAFFFDEDLKYNTGLTLGADTRLYVDLLAGAPGSLAALEGALGLPPGVFFAEGTFVAESTTQDNSAISLFGQVDWYLNDRTTVTLGLNYTQDDKDVTFDQANTDAFSTVDFVQVGFAQTFLALTGGQPPIPANFALFPVEFATAQALSTVPCTAATGPACNSLLALQPLQVLPQFVNFPNAVESGSSDDNDVTWTARIAFDVSDSVNLYASAGTGFKASSWNLTRDSRPFAADIAALQAAGLGQPNLVSGTRFAGAEESTVYELGLKAQFEKGAVNIAVFDQTIEDFQSNLFVGTGFALANAGEQSAFGVELDGSYYPVDSLQLTLAGTWMDPKYDSFPAGEGINGPQDLSGREPAGIHELSLTTTATYTKDFANGMTGFVRGEYLFESNVQMLDNVPASIASREVSVVNASFGLSTESGWDVTVWGRNLTDDEYLLSAFPSVFQLGSFSGYPNAPATYGVSVRKIF